MMMRTKMRIPGVRTSSDGGSSDWSFNRLEYQLRFDSLPYLLPCKPKMRPSCFT